MQFSELASLIGFGLTIFTIVGGLIQRDRALMQRMAEDKEKAMNAIAVIREDYVKKEDLREHITAIERSLDRLHSRLDQLLKISVRENA